MQARIAVLDYGMGNLRSVEKALERVGAVATVTRDHGLIRDCDGVVLPGVGAFPKAMIAVRELGFDVLMADLLEAGTPSIGLCMGMQLLFDSTTELGGGIGLGLLPGDVDSLDSPGLKLPQIGWNTVSWRRPSPLVEGLPDPCAFYHVHSFAPVASEPDDVLGTAVYGSEFVTAVERAPLFGVQFHPEKSGAHGLRLLENFAGICASVRAAA
jgi:glutamine amidotransferase